MRNLLYLVIPSILISCGNSTSIKDEFIRQRVLDFQANTDTLTVSVELIKWDTADLILKYLDKRIDTTTQANELMNTSPINRTKIISLVNELIKKDIDSFKDQIKNQSSDPPVRGEKKIKGNWKINRTIKFSQPLISSDNNTIIIKEWTSGNDCWGTTISVYQRLDNKWKKDFDIGRHITCN